MSGADEEGSAEPELQPDDASVPEPAPEPEPQPDDASEPEPEPAASGGDPSGGAASPPSGAITVDPLGLGALVTYLGIGVFLVFGFAWVLVPAVAAQNASPCRPLQPKALSGAAPDFEVQDLDGNTVRLSDFAGKFVVLNFWAQYCEPCITEWPQLHRMAERLADRDDVVVIAMSIDADESRPKLEPFLEQMSLTETDVLVLWDPDQKVHTAYGTKEIPDTYFIDESGQLVHAFINVREWGSPDALHCLDSVADR